MKISIVTPSFNRATFLDRTIESIVSQRGDFDLQYIVQDGGSGDAVLSILEKWKRRIEEGSFEHGCRSLDFSFYVEPDRNMYDAIGKGFSKADGDVYAWLNSDDMYHPFALSTVAQIFGKFDSVDWITGIPNSYNEHGARAGFDKWPPAYSRKYLSAGFYDSDFVRFGFNWIQQESTFWRKALWERVGGLDDSYAYAADFHLWQSFAAITDLVKVESFLGGFRVHGDQITADASKYRSELDPDRMPPSSLRRLKELLEVVPSARRRFLDFDQKAQSKLKQVFELDRGDLCGRVVEWSHPDQEWKLLWKLII